ncbi:MAG: glycerate kinase [Bacteroidales bacterium]|nr:glycerate kinase [Bacteroidales bacterium]
MNCRTIAEQIFLAGVESVLPERLITKEMALRDNCLVIGHLNFSLELIDNIYVIGAGKASAMMAVEVEKILDSRITEGHIVVKYGHSSKLKYIRVTEAGHPVPDSNGFKATMAIMEIAGMAKGNDLVVCVLSGGGSALLPDFPEGSSPEEMIKLNDLLINSGACIKEINAVRKHLSIVKGGQLARAVCPAILVSLILSDVPGDPLDVIASGPTAPDPTTYKQALDVLDKYDLTASVPVGILKYLKEGAAGKRPETPKPGDLIFEKSYNLLIGSNRLALEAAKQKASEFNINAVIIDDQLQGDTSSVAEYIVETSLKFKVDKNEMKPVCLLFGGETTVKMTGRGLGGRNQHLALLSAIMLENHQGITILSAGTDGTDGPTSAAGAVVDSDTVTGALSKNIDPAKYIRDFDSYHFFKKAGGQIITGPTMTNVMDIIVVIVE